MSGKDMLEQYEVTVGIECHVQLATTTKLFSSSDNDAREKAPNSVVNEIDYGLPGMLPVLNRHAVMLTIKAGLALNGNIAKHSSFDRKHYFYPDLPNGYQITQMYQPLIGKGVVNVPLDNGEIFPVRIHHAHLEADAGKLTHNNDSSLVDLNRAGTPLIEIVSEPDIHSPAIAKAYAFELYLLMVYSHVTLGDLYHGNMRFDVNVSVAKKDAKKLGTRTETKNLNSFKSVEKVVEYEYARQVALLEKGETISQETRGWDEAKQKTFSQRSKEEAHDYRYMPEPDIPPIILDTRTIEDILAQMPFLPHHYRQSWQSIGLDASVITKLLSDPAVARTVLMVQEEAGDVHTRRVANWYASTTSNENGIKENRAVVDTDRLVELSKMVEADELNSTASKEIFIELLQGSDDTPRHIAQKRNLLQLRDQDEIIAIVESVLADPGAQQALKDLRSGNDKAIGYLIGQVMKLSQGKANPETAQKLIRDRL